MLRWLHLVLYLANGSEGKEGVKRKKRKTILPAPPPHFFSVWSHLLFFLAHTMSSEVEPGRWWGYSLGKMCSNVISFKGAHGAERKDGLWYFCLLNLMVGLWHLYLLNVQNLIHHCWQSEHVLCGWHCCLFLRSDLTFFLFGRLRGGWEQRRSTPQCYHPGEMGVEISVTVFDARVGCESVDGGGILSGMEAARPSTGEIDGKRALGFAPLKSWHWLQLKSCCDGFV